MIKLIVSCLWIMAVTAASAYFGVTFLPKSHEQTSEKHAGGEARESKKTRPIDVPIIADGIVQGYIVAQFVYVTDTEAAKALSVPPEAYLLDEAFKTFYADDKLDFQHLERYDLKKMQIDLIKKVNARLGVDVLKDVLVDEFNYVSKSEISR
jgi:hypothetical protein